MLSAAAWLFLIVSLAQLAIVFILKLADPSGTVRMFAAGADGVVYDGMGLTYTGWSGVGRVLIQGLIVIAAIICTLLRARTPRRLGHLMLISWAGLFFGNLTYLFSMTREPLMLVLAVASGVFLVATVARAFRGRCLSQIEVDGDPCLTEAEVTLSPRVASSAITGPRVQDTWRARVASAGRVGAARCRSAAEAGLHKGRDITRERIRPAAVRHGGTLLARGRAAGDRAVAWLRSKAVLPGSRTNAEAPR